MINFQRTILPNGLTVIVEEDKSTTLCALNVLYKVGSKNETSDKTGFAHLFEHLMFGGSANAPDYDGPLQMAGGENNAFTNTDATNYYNVLPVENLETALWLEADRMAALNINDKSLEVQQKVVIEEFNEVCLNKPYGDNWHHLSALAYKEHPYAWPTIGKTPEHIKEAKLEDVSGFYKQYYNPGNAVITISGPLAPERAIELITKWFGNIPGEKGNSYTAIQEPEQKEQRYKLVQSDVPVPQFTMAFHMPHRTHEDYYACDLLSDILANGKSSRFYENLVRSKKLLSTVDCYLTGTNDPGLIVIEGRPAKGVSVQASISEIWKELAALHTNLPNERELQKVKNKVYASLAMSDLSILNKAISMAYYEHLGSLELMNEQEALYEKVTITHLLQVAKKYLHPSKASIIEYQPTNNK